MFLFRILVPLLTQSITKIINIAPLLNHNMAGVCGNLYSLAMGSVDNTIRFKFSPDRLATAVPEIYAMASLHRWRASMRDANGPVPAGPLEPSAEAVESTRDRMAQSSVSR